MNQRRSHPRNWQERQGQVNVRPSDTYAPLTQQGPRFKKRDHPRGTRFASAPDSVIVVSKRKGFGSLGNKESDKLPEVSVQILLKALRPETHHRYKVNIYCKQAPR